MAELTIKIKPDDVVERVIDEVAYKGKTMREWADLLTNPKTNADRIRAMSDEELAAFVANMVDHDWCCDSGCMIKHAGMCGYAEKGCDESALRWLQSPAGEVEDNA